MLSARVIWQFWRRACRTYWLGKSQLLYRGILGGLGPGSRIIRPLKFSNPEFICLGSRVTIHEFCWLGAYPQPGLGVPLLTIGDGATIGHFNHITFVQRVEIGPKVLTADRVHISDNEHVFSEAGRAIMDQGVVSRGPVAIGTGTWIGEGANILSCRIGKGCVIGANAVVIADVPDFSVAVGVPARVVKRYDISERRWLRVGGGA